MQKVSGMLLSTGIGGNQGAGFSGLASQPAGDVATGSGTG